MRKPTRSCIYGPTFVNLARIIWAGSQHKKSKSKSKSFTSEFWRVTTSLSNLSLYLSSAERSLSSLSLQPRRMQAISRRLGHQSLKPAASLSSFKSIYPLSDHRNPPHYKVFINIHDALILNFLIFLVINLQIMELIIHDTLPLSLPKV